MLAEVVHMVRCLLVSAGTLVSGGLCLFRLVGHSSKL
jgi:hypothetical protein